MIIKTPHEFECRNVYMKNYLIYTTIHKEYKFITKL